MSASSEAFLDDFDKPTCRPDDLFGAFDDDAVSSENGSQNRGPCIMKSYVKSIFSGPGPPWHSR